MPVRLWVPSLARTSLKDTKVIGNALCETTVGAGCEIDFAALRMFLLKKLQQLAVIWQVRDVEGNIFGDKSLECGLAAKNLSGEAQQQEGMSARQNQEGVDQSIRFDQGSIQIDAKRLELCCSGFRLRQDLRQPLPRVQMMEQTGQSRSRCAFLIAMMVRRITKSENVARNGSSIQPRRSKENE